MTELRVAHTADLDARTRHALRELLDLTFDGEFTDEDFSHSLGGMHALLHAEGTLIGHASVVQRQLLHGDRVLRTGYVEGVAVHPGHQRQGHGGRLMAPLERIIREGYELGALGAAQDASASTAAAAGYPGWDRPSRSPPPGSCAPRRRTTPSTSCPLVRHWIARAG